MSKAKTRQKHSKKGRDRLKKSDRRQRILLELKLRPHVRISDLARSFDVSTETVRRDFDALAEDGLIARAHGGASAPVQGHYLSLDERNAARVAERERIGNAAAGLVREGETVMIDSGSTTAQLARSLAYRDIRCTVITNSIPVAVTLGGSAAEVIVCPGAYLAAEAAVVGYETLEFLGRFNVDRCMIGASGLSDDGPSEPIGDIAAVKRAMLGRSAERHLLLDAQKFNQKQLHKVCELSDLDTLIVDTVPPSQLAVALGVADVELLIADPAPEQALA
ncbi:DeoR/GlpR family DNA-binding transcription regulator [Ruegeria arenilitoris]|uniref:DeoR/GlpR family DNA-binding transcription regulator n=1 Tax=Ruegeria arenilitoris TaxID=1173585 RepID=UPI00147DEEBB|nr:DeoR/GlpR family DNA-binding transcription regulator [Ruegeria arenilitoris]